MDQYYQFLIDSIPESSEHLDGHILYLPEIFKLISCLTNCSKIMKADRQILLTTLGYFLVPNDVIPEETFGPAGYLDDIYLGSYVLREIADRYGENLLKEHWHNDEPVIEIIDYCLDKTGNALGHLKNEILKFTGLID